MSTENTYLPSITDLLAIAFGSGTLLAQLLPVPSALLIACAARII